MNALDARALASGVNQTLADNLWLDFLTTVSAAVQNAAETGRFQTLVSFQDCIKTNPYVRNILAERLDAEQGFIVVVEHRLNSVNVIWKLEEEGE